jgi:hypothetical protein
MRSDLIEHQPDRVTALQVGAADCERPGVEDLDLNLPAAR